VRTSGVEMGLVLGQDLAQVGAFMMRIRSRSSRRTLPTHRSMMAFIRGACGAVSRIRMPSVLNTSSNNAVNLLSVASTGVVYEFPLVTGVSP
jgi:hypothetical protein